MLKKMLMIMAMLICLLLISYSFPKAEVTFSMQVMEVASMESVEPQKKTLKIMTYNIHHGIGVDGQLNLDRVVDTIKQLDADIVALNEVDNLMPRSSMQKQERYIAEKLGYEMVYGYNINVGAKYGNVLLSRYPITSWNNYRLPVLQDKWTEPRGLLQAEVEIEGRNLTVFITHLSTNTKERLEQIDFIVTKLEETASPKILLGDFNDVPMSNSIKKILDITCDSIKQEYNTYPTGDLKARIDYIFVSDDIKVLNSQALESDASDHLPVVAKVKLP